MNIKTFIKINEIVHKKYQQKKKCKDMQKVNLRVE